MAEAVRLQRYLAQSGVAARRKAEKLMLEGRVTVNGEVAKILGTKIRPGKDQVQVDGSPVYPEDFFYVILNKPKGCLTTVSDDKDRRTVMEYLTGLPGSVVPVGRLDYNSEGVLLLTNDGDLSHALQSPDSHAEKTYHVKVNGALNDAAMKTLRSGVQIGRKEVTQPAVVDKLRSDSKHQWLVMTLTEGKSRQIRRMMESLDHQVLKLQRVAFAGITFHGLRVGDARELTQAEVNQLYSAVQMERKQKSASRGTWSVSREETELGRRTKQREREAREQLEKEKLAAEGKPMPVRRARPPKRAFGAGSSGARAAGGARPASGRSAGRARSTGGRSASGARTTGGRPTSFGSKKRGGTGNGRRSRSS